jgi:hypothetical protein
MVVVTGHLVGLVVHEGQVDGQHQQQVTKAFPCRSFANLVSLGHWRCLFLASWHSVRLSE